MRSFPRDVAKLKIVMAPSETQREMTSLYVTGMMEPRIFWINTFDVRKRVMETETKRNMLAQPFWGDLLMNCSSLRQRRRRMEKKGRRQPLNT